MFSKARFQHRTSYGIGFKRNCLSYGSNFQQGVQPLTLIRANIDDKTQLTAYCMWYEFDTRCVQSLLHLRRKCRAPSATHTIIQQHKPFACFFNMHDNSWGDVTYKVPATSHEFPLLQRLSKVDLLPILYGKIYYLKPNLQGLSLIAPWRRMGNVKTRVYR